MPTQIQAAAGTITHDNFTAASTASSRTLPKKCNFVLIHNMDSAINVLASFDGGNNYKTIIPGTALSVDTANLPSLFIKSASGSPSVECLYGSES